MNSPLTGTIYDLPRKHVVVLPKAFALVSDFGRPIDQDLTAGLRMDQVCYALEDPGKLAPGLAYAAVFSWIAVSCRGGNEHTKLLRNYLLPRYNRLDDEERMRFASEVCDALFPWIATLATVRQDMDDMLSIDYRALRSMCCLYGFLSNDCIGFCELLTVEQRTICNQLKAFSLPKHGAWPQAARAAVSKLEKLSEPFFRSSAGSAEHAMDFAKQLAALDRLLKYDVFSDY